MNIKETVKEVHDNAVAKGFWDYTPSRFVPEKLMLIVSELGEACEADRFNKRANLSRFDESIKAGEDFVTAFKLEIKDGFEDEISDCIIRCFDLCGKMGIDIERHIRLKMEYNATRPRLHGKKY